MSANRIVVIGASAGGIDALRTLVSALPADFPLPICVVLHVSPESPGLLDGILSRAGHLPAVSPRDTERVRGGRIYVAPPDYHLVVEPGRVRVAKGPRENRFRPAIDPLFRSAAQVYGPGAIGVILTGSLDDGSAGLWTIKQLGGTAVVQDPADALYPSMPTSALAHVRADHVVPLREIAPLLVTLATQTGDAAQAGPPPLLDIDVQIAKGRNPVDAGLESVGEPSRFACPECHGVLLQLKDGGPVRFRCHTGHGYTIASLVADVSQGIEDALSNTLRALEEGALLLQHLTRNGADLAGVSIDLESRARRMRAGAEVVRTLLMTRQPLTNDDAQK